MVNSIVYKPAGERFSVQNSSLGRNRNVLVVIFCVSTFMHFHTRLDRSGYRDDNQYYEAGTSNEFNVSIDDEVKVPKSATMSTEAATTTEDIVSDAPQWDEKTRKRVVEEWMPSLNHSVPLSNRLRSVKIGNDLGYYGIIEDGGRLVVPATGFMLGNWDKGRELCQLLQAMTLKSSLDNPISHDSVSLPSPLLNWTVDCEKESRGGAGQGNLVITIYIVRMAAAKAEVDMQFQCSSGKKSQKDLILPWFAGYFHHNHLPSVAASKNSVSEWPFGGTSSLPPSEDEACPGDFTRVHLEYFHLAIQEDMRRMAVGILGPREPEHQKYSTRSSSPLYPHVTLDDVVIHFRCGDIFGSYILDVYGFLQGSAYLKWIRRSPELQSIGILTQPFEPERNREEDVPNVDACRQATFTLVDYLKKHYTTSEVQIRNDINETLPLAYARLVMAKQSFNTASTFSIIPVLGTFGDGYFQKGWLNHFASRIAEYASNVHEMEEPYLSGRQITQIGLNKTLEWLVFDTTDF